MLENFRANVLKMDKIREGSDLRKEKWGSPSIQESKIAAKYSIRTVTSLRDIFEKTWVLMEVTDAKRPFASGRIQNTGSMPCLFTFVVCDG